MKLLSPFSDAVLVGEIPAQEQYHVHPVPRGDAKFVMSRSELMEFDHCPARWLAGYHDEPTSATEWGTLVDCLTLCPDTFAERFAVHPATYPSTGMQCPVCLTITDSKSCREHKVERRPVSFEKDWDGAATFCKDWDAKQKSAGRKVVYHEQYHRAQRAAQTFVSNLAFRNFLAGGSRQVLATATYDDAATGLRVPVKILVDAVPAKDGEFKDCLGDVKTAGSAALRAWSKQVFNYHLHVQAAFYLDVFNAATGEDRQSFAHLIQESYSPYQTAKRILSSEFVELGRMKYQNALARYAKCIATGQWPDYDTDAHDHWQGWPFTHPEPWMLNAA